MDETRQAAEPGGRGRTRRTTSQQDVPPINPPMGSTASDRTSSDQSSASGGASVQGSQSTTSSIGAGSGQSNVSTGLMDRVRDRANAQLSNQKDRATDGIGSVAQAVRRSTQELREGHHETVAEYIERAADQLDQLSTRLKNKDVGQLLRDAQNLARRQPNIFIGTAFMLGLVGARFMKSSPHDTYEGQPAWQRTSDYSGGGPMVSGSTTGRGNIPVTENR